MCQKVQFELLAAYNQWMNAKIYDAAGQLTTDALTADRGAFFGSILGTLNHILVADIIWLQRFATHPNCQSVLQEVAKLPKPTRLNQILFANLDELSKQRSWLDTQIVLWVEQLTESDLEQTLSYSNVKKIPARKKFANLLLHFFNHQTHHRGQVTTLLSQAGKDVGLTDLLAMIPDENPA